MIQLGEPLKSAKGKSTAPPGPDPAVEFARACIHNLQTRNAELSAEVEMLRKRVRTLEARVAGLKMQRQRDRLVGAL